MSNNEQMNKKVETVADIIEEMRGMGNYQRYSGDHAHALADRIEAAWKRERAKVEADALAVGGIVESARTAEKSSAVGNAAAIRKALEKLDKLLFVGVDGYVHGQPDKTDEIERTIKSILSAPARNCDLYDDAVIAWRAWLEDKDNWDEFGSPNLELCEWLFASAKKKGENDGIK